MGTKEAKGNGKGVLNCSEFRTREEVKDVIRRVETEGAGFEESLLTLVGAFAGFGGTT